VAIQCNWCNSPYPSQRNRTPTPLLVQNFASKNTKFGAKSPPFCRNFKRKIEILNIHNFSVRNLHRKIPTSCPLPIFSTHDATAPKRALNGLCTSSSWIQLMKISDKKLLQSAAKMQITGSSI